MASPFDSLHRPEGLGMGTQHFIEPVTLTGPRLALIEPLQRDHVPALIEAARDGALWQLWYTTVPAPEQMAEQVEALLRQRDTEGILPFVVRRQSDGRVVGATRYMRVEPANRRLEIGGTWYAAAVQRSGLNTECKWLLLRHAFEQLGCIAVELRTHALNRQSRAAIERLGAKLDGILRNHTIMPNGTLRDTAVYSITAYDWPTVKVHLQWLMDKPREAAPC